MNEQVIQPYNNATCNVKDKVNNTILVNIYILILVEEAFIQVHGDITQVKARRNRHFPSDIKSFS